jgi:hypothetical protein
MARGRGRLRWRGQASKAPVIAAGRIGTPARRAATAAPPRNAPSAPSFVRVPSGNTATQSPPSRCAIIASSALRSGVFGRISTLPDSRMMNARKRDWASVARATNAT